MAQRSTMRVVYYISMKHQQTHPSYQEGCFGCRVSSLSIGTSEKFNIEKSREVALSKDLDAYKRLRQNNVQPKCIDGASRVEARAQEKWQVESGILPDK